MSEPVELSSFCPERLCDGSGWLLDEETNVARACPCRERRINRSANRRIGTGIPKRYRGVSFERQPVADMEPYVVQRVRQFARRIEQTLNDGRGPRFFGDGVTGQT